MHVPAAAAAGKKGYGLTKRSCEPVTAAAAAEPACSSWGSCKVPPAAEKEAKGHLGDPELDYHCTPVLLQL